MKKFFLLLLFLIAVFLEGSITTIPIVLDLLLILYIFQRQQWVFVLAFACGLLLDILSVRTFGQTSIFFLIVLLIESFYQRKYEITSSYFVLFYSFLGSIFFLLIFKSSNIFWEALVSAFFALILFKGIKLFLKMYLSRISKGIIA